MIFKLQAAIYYCRNRSERSGFRTVLRRRPVRPRNEAISERAAGERTFQKNVSVCRLLKASTTIPPTLLTPAGVPVAKTTPGRPTWSKIGVTAAWHRQQSTTPTLWDYPRPKGVVVRRLDCEPETPTARDSSAFTRRRMSRYGIEAHDGLPLICDTPYASRHDILCPLINEVAPLESMSTNSYRRD